jgi:hypothetical protein
MKIQATCSSEVFVDFQQTTLRCIQENRNLANHRWENIKFDNLYPALCLFLVLSVLSMPIALMDTLHSI